MAQQILSTNTFTTAKWIVSATSSDGTHTTIAAALTSASSGDTIFIRPGTYTENLTLKAGVNLSAYACDSLTPNVIISGTCTLTTAGTVSISGICLQTNSAAAIAVTGSAASIIQIKDCNLNFTNNTGITFSSSSASSAIRIFNSIGDLGTTGIALFTHTSNGILKFRDCPFTNSGASSTASTCSAGTLIVISTSFVFPVTTSGTSAITYEYVNSDSSAQNAAALTTGGSGTQLLRFSRFASGSASALSIGGTVFVDLCEVNSTNTNAITGAGTLDYSYITFTGSSSTINTTTQIPLVITNSAVKVVTPGAYPYTTVPQDAVILVDTASARSIVPLASPTTGQMHRIKDNVGSAAANNITITPSGKNIDGAASSTININYGSITIIYNGTEWSIV